MLHKSKIDLSTKKRESSIALLQGNLSSSIDLSLQIKQAHWNSKGMNFIAFHKFLDELHESINEFVDTLAERITALGGDAGGTLSQVAKQTSLPPYPHNINAIKDHIDALTTAIATLGGEIRKAIDLADNNGDMGTSDLFTEVSRGLDQNLWLLEAHIQS